MLTIVFWMDIGLVYYDTLRKGLTYVALVSYFQGGAFSFYSRFLLTKICLVILTYGKKFAEVS